MEDNKKEQVIKIVCLVIIFSCISSVLTSALLRKSYVNAGLSTKINVSSSSKKSVDNISTILKEFRGIIDEYYVGEVDDSKIVDETIKGYVKGLGDEYSEYMTADEWEKYQLNALGNYVGIGIYMSQDKNGNVIVLNPMEGSPAEKAGILPNDLIVEVDGESVLGCDTETIANMVKGEEGTKVKIKILRGEEYLDFNVERRAIKVYRVHGDIVGDNIGYIELPTFDDKCSEDFKNELENLKKKGAKKLIIDLRNNTGGLVSEALAIADMFLPKDDVMLVTIDAKQNKLVEKSEIKPITDMEVVVLINEYSASASEILVGALKDNERAKSVGKKTFGKGVIQTVLSLTDGSILKLTTAEYYTPNETKINKIGIEPDVEIESVDDEGNIDEQLQAAIELLK